MAAVRHSTQIIHHALLESTQPDDIRGFSEFLMLVFFCLISFSLSFSFDPHISSRKWVRLYS